MKFIIPFISTAAAFSIPTFSNSRGTPLAMSSTATVAEPGSVVTIECKLQPEGDFVPEPLFDMEGELSFVLGAGNYLPGLHELVTGMQVGEKVGGISIDAGWGDKRDDLILKMEKKDLEGQMDLSELKVGVQLMLTNGANAVVSEVTDTSFTIDANPPMAGASYQVEDLELKSVGEAPTDLEYSPEGVSTAFKAATFALGCFWGGELAFMRQPGVVGTSVGYTQGEKLEPTYKEVCSGTTGHTEAIQVIYDPSKVSYEDLVNLAMKRLGDNVYKLNQVGNDRGTQYRHGIYYHDDAQKDVAKRILDTFGVECKTECEAAEKYWTAEDYHQQYLLKGGQSAKKEDETTIRCYG